jgi:hypothetical protein
MAQGILFCAASKAPMTMDATKPQEAAQAMAATTDVEADIRDLVRAEALSAGRSGAKAEEPGSDNIAPVIQKVMASPIAEFEKLISELQDARSYLQSEGERIQRETDRYLELTQTASESVRMISGAIREWRTAGHPLQ